MGAGRVLAVVAVMALVGAGCFPDPPKRVDGDVSDASSGLDTSTPGDTGPQLDTEGGADTLVADTASDAVEDTAVADTTVADTLIADTAVVDTVAPECTSPADCQHLAGTCVRVQCLGGSCAAQPDTGNPCDDGQACTKADTCQGFSCVGTAYACDDGVACTDDVCTGDGGCSYPAKAGFCHIGAACVTAGKVKADDPCRVCVGGEAWSGNDGASCEDGDAVCTLDDTCVGTVCEPGGPPDDTAGDWAMNVVESTSPQASVVMGVVPFGIRQWVLMAKANGGGVVPTTSGPVTYSRTTLALLARGVGSTWIAASFAADGDVGLDAYDSYQGNVAWAVTLDGPGSAMVGSVTRTQDDNRHTYLAALDVFGSPRYLIEVANKIDGLVQTTDGLVTVATAVGATSVNGEVVTFPEDGGGTVLRRYDAQAQGLNEVLLETPTLLPGPPTLARAEDDVLLSATIRNSAILHIGNDTTSIASPTPNTTITFVRLSKDLTAVRSVLVPFEFTAEIAPPLRSPAPQIYADAMGITAIFWSGAFGNVESMNPLMLGAAGSSIIRLDWSGAPVWAVNANALIRSTRRADGSLVLTAVSGNAIALSLTRPEGTVVYSAPIESPSSIVELSSDGDVAWAVDMPSAGGFFPASVAVSSSSSMRGVAVGGAFFGAGVDFVLPASGLALTGQATLNGAAFLLNSEGQIACEQ